MSGQINDAGPTPAQKIEAFVREGKSEAVGQELGKCFITMRPQEFEALLGEIKAENAIDVRSDRSLPHIEIVPMGKSVEVDMTTPSDKYGNVWRDKKAVFIDVETKHKSDYPFKVGANDGETVVAGKDTFVLVSGREHVIALPGSNVIAEDTSDVDAKNKSLVQLRGHASAVAEAGSYVVGLDDSRIYAKKGSQAGGFDRVKITAEQGANALVDGHAVIVQAAK